MVADREQVELLREGVKVWNRWREDCFHIEVNLYDASLPEANLSRANLREANLNRANLMETDLSEAILTEADLSQAFLSGANLSRADLRKTHLSDADLTCADLSGANLRESDLRRSDLSKANLSYANLRGANLSGVNLKGANFDHAILTDALLVSSQLLGADLTSANLTGACIQDWNINNKTRLDDVICEYVYLKQNNQERRPSSGSFKPSEFILLFQKALETVDLIFAEGIDWQVFFQSFVSLRSQYDENLSIQAIEKKSGDAFIIRLEVPPEADKAAIERQAKELYEMKLQLQEQRYRAELQAKDGQISLYQEQLEFHRQSNTNLMEIVKTMAEKENQPTYQTTINAQMIGATHTGSGNITNFTQNINSNIDDITKLITSLRDSVQTFPEAQREEALEHLEDVEEGIRQPNKIKPHRIKAALAALLAIAGMVAATTDFSNNILEIGDKLGIELIQTQPNQQLPPSQSK